MPLIGEPKNLIESSVANIEREALGLMNPIQAHTLASHILVQSVSLMRNAEDRGEDPLAAFHEFATILGRSLGQKETAYRASFGIS